MLRVVIYLSRSQTPKHQPKMKFSTSILATLLTTTSAFLPSLQQKSSTSLHARKPFISGNWKLNPQTRDEAITLAKEISEGITADSPNSDVALFVPYVFIESAITACEGKYFVGAEVCLFYLGLFYANFVGSMS